MTIPTAVIAEVRDWTGDAWPTDDDAITTQLVRFDDDPQLAALALLRRRAADLELGYSSFSTDGDASWTRTTDLLNAVQAKIARLERLTGADATSGRETMTGTPIVGPEGQSVACWPGTERARLGG